MRYVCALITVEDIARSKDFYQTIMNQTIREDYGEDVVFEGGFAIHQRSHFSGLIDHRPITPGTHNCELYFEHPDVDGFAELLLNHNVTLIHSPRIQPWGQNVVRFYDPDLNVIEVGQPL
ncbi:MAG: glyoxalase/bleomycin resistance/dioxygenase family protein [Candidatus Delongbacteria bacterium]|nr:glyoxalase/bleomycin resistance/dioxygenase family protein [Candidatus Delongbacteria bacterium]